MSTIYYAMFHSLARHCADLLIGSSGADRSVEAWRQVYRALDHGTTRTLCSNQAMLQKFPKQIADFAVTFVQIQAKRHDADYDPSMRFSKSEVAADIIQVEQAIAEFGRVLPKHRRAFCAYVLLRQRRP